MHILNALVVQRTTALACGKQILVDFSRFQKIPKIPEKFEKRFQKISQIFVNTNRAFSVC